MRQKEKEPRPPSWSLLILAAARRAIANTLPVDLTNDALSAGVEQDTTAVALDFTISRLVHPDLHADILPQARWLGKHDKRVEQRGWPYLKGSFLYAINIFFLHGGR